jgi:hypothetical protein
MLRAALLSIALMGLIPAIDFGQNRTNEWHMVYTPSHRATFPAFGSKGEGNTDNKLDLTEKGAHCESNPLTGLETGSNFQPSTQPRSKPKSRLAR